MTSDTVKIANTSALGMYCARWYIEGRKFDLYTVGETVFISWRIAPSSTAEDRYVNTVLANPERFGWQGAPKSGKQWMTFARTVAASFAN